jgi:hypothetical protein
MTENIEIAATILAQLGGKMFITTTGAKDFVAIENGVRFRIGRNATQANMVKIILEPSDTYTMQFIRIGREVNPYDIMYRYINKGLSEEEFNTKVRADIDKAKKNAEPKVLKEYEDVYCDMLEDIFRNYTKLETKLL